VAVASQLRRLRKVATARDLTRRGLSVGAASAAVGPAEDHARDVLARFVSQRIGDADKLRSLIHQCLLIFGETAMRELGEQFVLRAAATGETLEAVWRAGLDQLRRDWPPELRGDQ
jgi:hypothetical protein